MKKLTLGVAVAGLTASLGAYAALPTGAAPFQVNVPNLNSGFMFNLTGLYLKPGSTDLDYANNVATSGTVTTLNEYSVKPKYKPGFNVGFGYVFPNSGNDVQLNWTHLNANTSTSVTGTDLNPPQVSTIDGTGATANARFKYNAVDLDAGQYVNFGTRLQSRLFAGLRYANIKRDFDSSFTNVGGVAADTFAVNQDATTWGVGPRFGVNSTYNLGANVGFVADVATALLYSKAKHSETLPLTVSGATTTGSIVPDNSTRLVPDVDGKLGLNYSAAFGGSVFTVEAGYQVIHYFDAIDSVTGTGLNYTGSVDRESTSVSFDGPYLSLNYKI